MFLFQFIFIVTFCCEFIINSVLAKTGQKIEKIKVSVFTGEVIFILKLLTKSLYHKMKDKRVKEMFLK